ncbi:MAG: hypothetical protein K5979_13375 [Ruminococcus sp.]|nr:hypothetical protein [Ruminococcus sp.]
MICAACGTENENGFKFCVKCGSSLENAQPTDYDQVDMGGYHTEEDFSSANSGYTVGSGTFTISDRAPIPPSSDAFSSDELNESEEEYDFSEYDEPYIPRLDPDRVSLPKAGSEPIRPQTNGYSRHTNPMGGMPNQNMMGGMPNQNMMNGMQNPQSQMGANPYMNQQAMMYGQPPIVGYDPSGMPIYGQPQPMMYGQPPVVGYDQNGMPIYGQSQPMMYGQPPIVGYDPSGMPIYGQPQPMMYGQPPVVGYDQNGMPIYGQPQPMPDPNMPIPSQNMHSSRHSSHGLSAPPMPSNDIDFFGNSSLADEEQNQDKNSDTADDFWKFFDGGNPQKRHESPDPDDFFGKSSRTTSKNNSDMNDLSIPDLGMDMTGMKRNDKKKNSYMNDLPIVDGSKLAHNDNDKFNRFYMKDAENFNSNDLTAGSSKETKRKYYMGMTDEVDAGMLTAATKSSKSHITMYSAGKADPDQLEAYIPEHKEALMDQANNAVESLPRKKMYQDELDMIEIPEYMEAKKTPRGESIEIPSLPKVGID